MATVVNAGANQVKLGNGQLETAQQGAWYDGQQYWGGTLSQPGQINSLSNQQGAGQAVSSDVIAQTNPNNVAFVNQQRQAAGLTPAPSANQATQLTAVPSPSGGSTSGSGGGIGALNPSTPDLSALYTSLSKGAGISDLEDQITQKTSDFNTAQSQINDNPWLSESDRTGRIQKLTTDFNNNITNDQNALAMKQADVNTQIQLQTQQFDINSQAATQALDSFNSLLQSGALDNASGQDIANITSATGLSSQAIQSAISANQAKNVQTQVVSYDDGTNQGFAVINSQTGAIISKQTIAASKPAAASAASTKQDQLNAVSTDAQAAATNGKTLDWLMANYISYGLSKDQIYAIYQNANYYHPTAAQEEADQKKYGV